VSSKTTAKGRTHMVKKRVLNRISISIPQSKLAEKLVERLLKVAKKRDRSPNHLVVEAILEYLKREEKKG
jgi:metal-responsive CopG/Arc/MetJ family transcriptional regulator